MLAHEAAKPFAQLSRLCGGRIEAARSSLRTKMRRHLCGHRMGGLDAAAAQARELREWFRHLVQQHAGKPLQPLALHELAPLNQLLGQDKAYRQIELAVDDAHGLPALRWQAKHRWDSPKSLLLPIAEAMGDLVCETDLTLVRQCEGPTCTLWFRDLSKRHARRWCSMAVCGNRAKVAAHRARARSSAD